MEKIKQRCKDLIFGRTVGYYIALAVALVTLCVSIAYAAMFAGTEQFSAGTFVLCFFAAFVFVGFSFFGMPKTGAAGMALFAFFSFVVFVIDEYSYIYNLIADTFMGDAPAIPAEFLPMAYAAGMLLVTAILGNIVAWLNLGKRPVPDPVLYENLTKIMREKGLSEKELAASLATDTCVVHSWLKGKAQPSYEMLLRLQEVYGVSPEELFVQKDNGSAPIVPAKEDKGGNKR